MNRHISIVFLILIVLGILVFLRYSPELPPRSNNDTKEPEPLVYEPRHPIETSGILFVFASIEPWGPNASLEEYAAKYTRAIPRGLEAMDQQLVMGLQPIEDVLMTKAAFLNARGDPAAAYQVLKDLEEAIKGTNREAEWLYTIIHHKGVTALRMGENDNCVLCRGESACIFPISPTAVHTNQTGSRLAIEHFSDYLRRFPDDLEVKWLLNLAHMTLGEHPAKVDPHHRLLLDAFCKSEFDVGQFRDISHDVGLTRFNYSGGGIMEDFDNDDLLDLVVTGWAPNEPMAFYRNKGDGTFEDRTKAAGLEKQLGGLYCVQTDYNNDGHLDIFIPRGSWLPVNLPQRPSLLRNNGDGTFTDVTREAGLLAPTNSTSATWADYDNDGFLDLFVCCQRQPCLLYRNKGDGTFEEVAARAGLGNLIGCLGAAWIDFDNDGYPDLFVNIDGSIAGGARPAISQQPQWHLYRCHPRNGY
ncbi:MAG TPA: VCBS repeat-containing protein [Gemmata sp.]|jgi:hypothetical protein|nr:VCBS repeat-containing protein [Gemmata sp.]